MGATAHGRILFWEGASLWLLRAPPGQPYPRTAPHAHHAVQLTLALTGTIAFEGGGRAFTGSALAIAPDTLHAFEGTGLVAHLFVAPDGKLGRQLARGLFSEGPIAPIPVPQLGELPARLKATFEDPDHTQEALRELGRSWLARLGGLSAPVDGPDPRVARLLTWLAPRLHGAVSLHEAAAFVGLSPGRARHLFVEQTGLPFRSYVLWQRLTRALELYAGQASLTEAAHGAGFADSAHLSRTFRRMFGIAAATLRLV